ncbi:MAG: DUF2029 domain-containing protein [Candidatus Dormibacteraeota bacterium]|nr:DUF2029 domain-containing protein [Candidatus Dormibacteraeota bacterium]
MTPAGRPGRMVVKGSATAPDRARLRSSIALGGLAVLAVAGQLVLNQAAVTIAHSLGEVRGLFTVGRDFWPIWYYNRYIISGQGSSHVYGLGRANPWPPPHELAFAPLSYLPWEVVHLLSTVATAAVILLAVLLWSKKEELFALRSGLWPMLLTAPVFAVIWIDQLPAALGLLALSLAIWAQRRERWWLVGVAGAVSMIRVANAVPVLLILLLSFWGKPKQLGIAIGSALLAMAPLATISFIWDPHWITDYINGIAAYPFNGTAQVASHSFGYSGLGMLALVGTLVGVFLTRRGLGGRLDPGRAALAIGITVVVAPLGGLYCGIFALPALIRLGMRPGFWMVPWIAAIGPWAIVLGLSPFLLGHDPGLALIYVSFIDFGLLLLAYPLLRMPPEVEASAIDIEPGPSTSRYSPAIT